MAYQVTGFPSPGNEEFHLVPSDGFLFCFFFPLCGRIIWSRYPKP